jgi:hypothetical protein
MTNTPDGLFCPGCGYDLRALSSDRCPECGLTIDPNRNGIIPWESRKSLGRFRSFFRTLRVASFRPTHLALAVSAPVDLRSARLFRRIVIVVAAIPSFVVIMMTGRIHLALLFGTSNDDAFGKFYRPNGEPAFLWSVGTRFWPVLPVGLLITLKLATGISHWFYVPKLEKAKQNRVMVISYYLSAPLFWLAIPLCIPAIILVTSQNSKDLQPQLAPLANLGLLLSFGTLAAIGLLLLNNIRALPATTVCGWRHTLGVSAGVALQAVCAIIMGLGFFPALMGFFWLMLDNLSR